MTFGNAKRKEPRSLPYQAPTGRKCRTEHAANKNVVIQIPDRRLTRAGIVKHIVGLPVAAYVALSHNGPAAVRQRRKRASATRSRQYIQAGRMVRTQKEMAISRTAVDVPRRLTSQAPTGRKCGTEHAAN